MNVSGLLTSVEALAAYGTLRDDLRRGELPAPLGLLRAARPAVVAALARDLDRPALVVAGSVERAKAWAQSLRAWCPTPRRVRYFYEPMAMFYERAPWTEDVVVGRLRVLTALQQGEAPLLVASARALMQRTLPPQQFRLAVREFHVGQLLDLRRTVEHWTGAGYEPVTVVEAPGQFSHRGGILDIFPPADALPVRIELFGDQIDSMRRFDPATQRSEARVERLVITPAREALPRHGPRVAEHVAAQLQHELPADVALELSEHQRNLADQMPFPGLEFYLPYFYTQPVTLLDYLPAEALIVLDDPAELGDTWAALEEDAVSMRAAAEEADVLPAEYPLPYVTWDAWSDRLTDRAVLTLGHGSEGVSAPLANYFDPAPHFGGQIQAILAHLRTAQARGEQVVVVSQQAPRLAELWGEQRPYHPPLETLTQPPGSALTFVRGALAEGWLLHADREGADFAALHLLTDAELFGWRRPQPRRSVRRRRPAPEAHFADLTPGDFVVHVEHGVGVFRGLVTRAMEGSEREYLLVQYAGSDRLYVPIYQADRLSRYIGADDRPPRLNRLGSATWGRARQRAKEAAEAVAQELLELYAAREMARGHAFSPDTPWQAELEASFPYFETEDQLDAIADVKTDMEQAKPMDRLICGDVGYGKTEVALRAAFKAVMDGKQVAFLVPTTVLAQQHSANFQQRLSAFPVEVEMLSRFRSRAEQRDILERLTTGQVDIVIGTHRLLQPDVSFADLGLLIVDEEQRFGVTHKERLKQLRTEIDVLTMTATPIPRTLYLALTGVRDISVIDTPPEERLPVSTYVGQYDDQLVRRAILRELERGGQVFYVHNRVRSIEMVRRRLERLVPEATFAVGHGQMREADLERGMVRFTGGEIDVLVCTSIIESGLDIPNANTLIVERADRFGLAQLYQLRGRVGRGAQRAYAYFFHQRMTRLTPEARERLETIREASDLGAGYTIAMRDLELRGAGDILGMRQSGHIASVGFDLYTRLLTRAVQERKAERRGVPPPPQPLDSIKIYLPIPAHLPDDYVPDVGLRLQIYRRVAEMGSLAEIEEMGHELADRFGALPPEAENLLYQLRLKVLARDAGVEAIAVENGRLALRSGVGDYARQAVRKALGRGVAVSRRTLWLPMEDDWREALAEALRALGALR